MNELIQILAVVITGLFAAEAFIASHESHAERRQRRQTERWVKRTYPPTY
jgi:hypothetical protein